MKKRKAKAIPAFIDIEPLKNFVEQGSEVSKSELIMRIAGKVSYPFFQLVKLIQFHSVRKEGEDLYIL